MNTILVLRGRANVGKSTTIRKLSHLLLNNGFVEIEPADYDEPYDFSAVFSKNNKKIGITSSGDTYDLVLEKLKKLVNNPCEVCICACRSRGRTNDAIFEFKDYSNLFIEKTIDETGNEKVRDNLNSQDALKLLGEINKFI